MHPEDDDRSELQKIFDDEVREKKKTATGAHHMSKGHRPQGQYGALRTGSPRSTRKPGEVKSIMIPEVIQAFKENVEGAVENLSVLFERKSTLNALLQAHATEEEQTFLDRMPSMLENLLRISEVLIGVQGTIRPYFDEVRERTLDLNMRIENLERGQARSQELIAKLVGSLKETSEITVQTLGKFEVYIPPVREATTVEDLSDKVVIDTTAHTVDVEQPTEQAAVIDLVTTDVARLQRFAVATLEEKKQAIFAMTEARANHAGIMDVVLSTNRVVGSNYAIGRTIYNSLSKGNSLFNNSIEQFRNELSAWREAGRPVPESILGAPQTAAERAV